MVEHISKMVEYKGEHMALLQARKLVVGYFKGMRGAAALRNEAGKIATLDDLKKLRQKALEAGKIKQHNKYLKYNQSNER